MVQLLSDPTLSASEPAQARGTDAAEAGSHVVEQDGLMTREEHAQKTRELLLKRGLARAPKRGWSMTGYEGENQLPQAAVPWPTASHGGPKATIPENSPLNSSPAASVQGSPLLAPVVGGRPAVRAVELTRRPKMPPPRRSYSVMDYEPLPPGQPRPSSRLTLLDLPPELFYTLLDFLDPIDGVCLGLAHSSLYSVHKKKYGTVPLSSRYSGPNDMEWAWRGAGPLLLRPEGRQQPEQSQQPQRRRELDRLRVKGQVYCRKCGVLRCELHRHLKDWMGEGYEYCEIRRKFGAPADADAKPYCYMSSPKHPQRCGRHGGVKEGSKMEERPACGKTSWSASSSASASSASASASALERVLDDEDSHWGKAC